jgi:hypothetical protein
MMASMSASVDSLEALLLLDAWLGGRSGILISPRINHSGLGRNQACVMFSVRKKILGLYNFKL